MSKKYTKDDVFYQSEPESNKKSFKPADENFGYSSFYEGDKSYSSLIEDRSHKFQSQSSGIHLSFLQSGINMTPDDRNNTVYWMMIIFGMACLLPWNSILTSLDFFADKDNIGDKRPFTVFGFVVNIV